MKDGCYQILHVEDESTRYRNYKRMIESALNEKGVKNNISQADSLEEACQKIMESGDKLDLILLDIALNNSDGKTGLDLVQMMHTTLRKDIPTYVVSANVERFRERLEQYKNKQWILGYSEPLDDNWPDYLYDILVGKKVNILHLSDIHNGRFFAYDNLIVNKESVLNDLCQKVGDVDFAIISGDISSTNCDEDYMAAGNLLNSLRAKLSLDPRCFVFTPGNHDHDLSCFNSHTFSRYLNFLDAFYNGSIQEDSHYPNHEVEDYDNIEQAYSELFSIVAYPEHRTLVVSFNSVNPLDFSINREQICPVGEDGKPCTFIFGGYISSEQIINVSCQLQNLYSLHPELKKFVKIATFHHNLFEPAHIEQILWRPTLINQGNLLSFLLNNDFLLVLHGHLHYKEVHYYQSYRNKHGLNIISTGTFSGKDRALDTDFCANKITYRVSPQGNAAFLRLYQYTLSRDSIQWAQQEITLL